MLTACDTCSRSLDRLRSVRWTLRDKVASYQPPDKDFWRRNLEAVGEATWQSSKPGRKSNLRTAEQAGSAGGGRGCDRDGDNRHISSCLSIPRTRISAFAAGENITTEALVDSLYMLAELARQYELTYSAMESMEELATETESESYQQGTGFTYPVTGNVYDALLDMDDDQLDQILMVLASN